MLIGKPADKVIMWDNDWLISKKGNGRTEIDFHMHIYTVSDVETMVLVGQLFLMDTGHQQRQCQRVVVHNGAIPWEPIEAALTSTILFYQSWGNEQNFLYEWTDGRTRSEVMCYRCRSWPCGALVVPSGGDPCWCFPICALYWRCLSAP